MCIKITQKMPRKEIIVALKRAEKVI